MSKPIWKGRADDLWHVFQLPETLPNGYCFGGGREAVFLLVDWFNAPPIEMPRSEVIAHLKAKQYLRAGFRYMVVSNDGDAFILPQPTRPEGE